MAWMDVVLPGWTWRPRDGRGEVVRDVARSSEGLHGRQRVCTVVRGSARSSEGLHGRQRSRGEVGGDVARSAESRGVVGTEPWRRRHRAVASFRRGCLDVVRGG